MFQLSGLTNLKDMKEVDQMVLPYIIILIFVWVCLEKNPH